MGSRETIKFKRQQAEILSRPIIQYLKSSGLWYGLYRNKVFETWDALSGAGRYTIRKYLKDNVLYITVSSSALRNRLQYQLPLIMKKINETIDADELLGSGGAESSAMKITGIILR